MSVRRIPALVAALTIGASSLATAGAPANASGPRVLRVGTWHGISGSYPSIQAAVDAARAGDWILVGPGDWKERGDHTTHKPAAGEPGWGVTIEKANLHLRGMNRNTVVVDGTKPGTPKCSNRKADQDFGTTSGGRSGIVVYKVNGTYIENLTVCNFLGEGNEIWWNGGDGSGHMGMGSYWGSYLNATSTYYGGSSAPQATYGIFVSNARGPGLITKTYASNMNDASYYIGACSDCNAVLDHPWAENSALGYSGTNSGGHLIIQYGEWDDNASGIVTNSQNNDDAPSPQDGACPSGTGSCEIYRYNYIHDNNNPNVPQSGGAAGAGPVGTGIVIAGGRHDTVVNNRISNNKAWGILTVPYPDTEVPPSDIGQHCQGGSPNTSLSAVLTGQTGTVLCYFSDWGNEIAHNTFSNNGGYGNPTNGDIGDISQPAPEDPTATGNCWHDNSDTGGTLTMSPPTLSTTNSSCPAAGWGMTDPVHESVLIVEVSCDSQLLFNCAPPSGVPAQYPQTTKVAMKPLPTAKLPTMPNPCAGVPVNPWCPGAHHGRQSAGGGNLAATGLSVGVPAAALVLLVAAGVLLRRHRRGVVS
jgi:hypothetical protein